MARATVEVDGDSRCPGTGSPFMVGSRNRSCLTLHLAIHAAPLSRPIPAEQLGPGSPRHGGNCSRRVIALESAGKSHNWLTEFRDFIRACSGSGESDMGRYDRRLSLAGSSLKDQL